MQFHSIRVDSSTSLCHLQSFLSDQSPSSELRGKLQKGGSYLLYISKKRTGFKDTLFKDRVEARRTAARAAILMIAKINSPKTPANQQLQDSITKGLTQIPFETEHNKKNYDITHSDALPVGGIRHQVAEAIESEALRDIEAVGLRFDAQGQATKTSFPGLIDSKISELLNEAVAQPNTHEELLTRNKTLKDLGGKLHGMIVQQISEDQADRDNSTNRSAAQRRKVAFLKIAPKTHELEGPYRSMCRLAELAANAPQKFAMIVTKHRRNAPHDDESSIPGSEDRPNGLVQRDSPRQLIDLELAESPSFAPVDSSS